MKMNKFITTVALVLASVTLIQGTAKAQSASPGDLILGFQTGSSSDTGNSTNVEVDLGQYSLYTAAAMTDAGTIINLSSDLSVSDLSVYGSSPTDLFFGVIGTNGTTSSTRDIFITSTTGNDFADGSNSSLATS